MADNEDMKKGQGSKPAEELSFDDELAAALAEAKAQAEATVEENEAEAEAEVDDAPEKDDGAEIERDISDREEETEEPVEKADDFLLEQKRDGGIYDNLFEDDWEAIVAAQEAADKDAAKKEKAKKRRKQREKEAERQRETERQNYEYRRKMIEEAQRQAEQIQREKSQKYDYSNKDHGSDSFKGSEQAYQESACPQSVTASLSSVTTVTPTMPVSYDEVSRTAESGSGYTYNVNEDYEKSRTKELEQRRREEAEQREAEIRQRERERHEEFLKNAERIKAREEASLGKVMKTSHLDFHEGADNTESYLKDRLQNPTSESSAVNPTPEDSYQTDGTSSSQSAGYEPQIPRSATPGVTEVTYPSRPTSSLDTHTEYTYTPSGVRSEERKYADDGGMNPRPNLYTRDERENRVLDAGYARASYTLTGVAIQSDVAGRQGTGVADNPVIRVNPQSKPTVETTKPREETRLPLTEEKSAASSFEVAIKPENFVYARRDVLTHPDSQSGGVCISGDMARRAVSQAEQMRKAAPASTELGDITNHRYTESHLNSKEDSKRELTEKKEVNALLGGQTGIENGAHDAVTKANTTKFDFYKARYGSTAASASKRVAGIAAAVVMSAVIDGERANGYDVIRKTTEGTSYAVRSAFYMMHKDGNQMIAKATRGQFKNEKELKKFDKENLDVFKQLRQERNQLIGSINRSLRVSGNAGIALRSVDDVDRMLVRMDISQETRKQLNDLRANMMKTLETGTWLERNAAALSGQVKRELLDKVGAKNIHELDIKKLNKLIEALNKDNARLSELLTGEQSAEAVLNIKESLAANLKARDLLKDRQLVMKGKRNNHYRKMGVKMVRRAMTNKLIEKLNETDVDGFHAIAGGLSMVRKTKDAVFIAKNTARATKFVAGKTADAGRKAIEIAKQSAQKVIGQNVGRSYVDNQINSMLIDRYKPKPKPKKRNPRLVDSKEAIAKKAKDAKKIVEVTRKVGTRISEAATRVAAGVKAAAATVGKAAGAVASGIGGIATLGAGGVALLIIAAVAVVIILILILFSTFATDDDADIQRVVDKINTNRDEVVLDSIYDAFKGETDPFGHPYGYTTLDGKTSDNMLSGVTWEYADGVSNNTAEIISLAAVYYQQDWPSSNEIVNMFSSDDKAFFTFCRDLSGYALDVTAKESHPYSCLIKGGCVLGYRDNGQKIEIKDYRLNVTNHHCSEGNRDCGYYDWWGQWQWANEHGPNNTITEETVEEDGTHDVYVYFPNKLPDGAKQSELTKLPDDYTIVTDGAEIDAASVHGNLVFDASTLNIYKGDVDDWFYEPGELTGSFTVVTHLDDENERRDTYTVTFGGDGDSTTAIPWCPGELNDSLHGHYDLNCTVYLTGYDRYEEPCLKPDDPENDDVPEDEDGVKGGTGTLEPLAKEISSGQLTRTVQKLNQWMMPYAGGTAARFTATVTLPAGDEGFTYWYDENGEDSDGNVAWAKMLYAQDWEELYGVTKGIKCRSFGSKMTEEEYEDLIANMDFGNITDARQKVIEVAIKSSGQFSYSLGSKPVGGPGNVKVKGSYDCSGFVRYCYWMAGLSFDAVNTYDYAGAGDLVQISASEMQPGDLQVMTAGGGVGMGHVRMLVGTSGGKLLWAECVGGKGSLTNTWTNAQAGMSNCRYYRYTGF